MTVFSFMMKLQMLQAFNNINNYYWYIAIIDHFMRAGGGGGGCRQGRCHEFEGGRGGLFIEQ